MNYLHLLLIQQSTAPHFPPLQRKSSLGGGIRMNEVPFQRLVSRLKVRWKGTWFAPGNFNTIGICIRSSPWSCGIPHNILWPILTWASSKKEANVYLAVLTDFPSDPKENFIYAKKYHLTKRNWNSNRKVQHSNLRRKVPRGSRFWMRHWSMSSGSISKSSLAVLSGSMPYGTDPSMRQSTEAIVYSGLLKSWCL